ncbi:MAG: ATP-binding protein [Chthoniobacterales bacterium]
MPNLTSPATLREQAALLDRHIFHQSLRSATRAVMIGLGVPSLALLGMIFILLRASAWVEHTDAVIAQAHEVETTMLAMQAGSRGFWLTHEEAFLAPYTEGEEALEGRLKGLQNLVSDNPSQTAQAGKVEAALHEWRSRLAASMAEERTAPTSLQLEASAALSARARQELKTFVNEEERLRDERVRRVKWSVAVLFATLGGVALVGIPWLTLRLKSLLRKLNATYSTSLSAVHRRADELHVTLNSIGDAVLATDSTGRVEFLNPVAEEMTGWTNAEAQGKPLEAVFVIFNEETGATTENPVARVLRENVVVGLANHTVLRSRQGVEVAIEDSAAPIRDEAGKVLGVILVFHDASASREAVRLLGIAKKKADEANRSKDALLATLSHELRTPLTPVLFAVEFIRSHPELPAELLEEVAMIKRNIQVEVRLIDDLLDISKIIQGKLFLELERRDIHDLIVLAMEMVRPQAVEKKIELVCECEASKREWRVDPARFQQVIWNLLRNAIKFSPDGGSIQVITREKEGGGLRIEVIDHGIGIQPEMLGRIFQPFDQGELRENHRYGGMGLGLAISKAVVEAHGATIRAVSEGLGRGAQFIVEWPAPDAK